MDADLTLATVSEWAVGLEALHARIAPRFARAEPRRRALAVRRGRLSRVERPNGWQLAEEAGERTPDGMQRLLTAVTWDAEAVRGDPRADVVEHLGDPGAVRVIDETGFRTRGTKSVGVNAPVLGDGGPRRDRPDRRASGRRCPG